MTNHIASYPVPLVFKFISRRRSSGQMVIKSRGTTRRLFFSDGKLDFAQSEKNEEHLVEMLLLSGILSRDEAVKIKSRLGRGEPTRVGRLLVGEGILSEKKLYDCLIAQATMIAANTFGLTEGRWEFLPEEAAPAGQAFAVALPKIIVLGSRMIKDFSHYRAMFSRCVLKAVKLPEKTKRLLSPFELKFLGQIAAHPGKNVGQIISGLPYADEICWREVLKLYLLNGLEFSDTDKWASNTDTLIQARLDLAKTQESAPPPPRKAPRPGKDLEATAVTQEEKTELHRSIEAGPPPSFAPELSSSQRSINVIFHMAQRLYREGKFREAALILYRAVRPGTSPATHLTLLGMCQAKVPQMQSEAENNLRLAAEMDEKNPDPAFALADFYRDTGRVADAVEAYRRALKTYQHQHHSGPAAAEAEPPRRRIAFTLRKKS